jgi:exonuclease SbcC
MQLKIKKVHLKNFRIHDDYIFEPSENGVTAIIGNNGHGKSSIIDGIAWALYGTKPNSSMKNSLLRKIGVDESEPCYVDVILSINGNQNLRVKRSIKGKNTVQCECWVDDVLEAGPAVSHADRWIPKMLGIDEEGFLSAVLVQQKQVGAIVSESASIRQQNIEKLTGITAATNAVKAARDEANALKKAISMIAPEASNIDDTRKTIHQLEEEGEKIQRRRDALKKTIIGQRDEYTKAARELHDSSELHDRKSALSHDYDVLNQHVQDLSSRRDSMTTKIQDMRGKLPTITDYKPLQKQYDATSSTLQSLKAKEQVLESIIANDVDDESIASLKYSIDNTDITGFDRDSAAKKLESLRLQISSDNQRIKQYKKSIKGLSSGKDENMVCPTCLQSINDIEHVRKEFNEMISTAEKDVDECSKNAESLEAEVNKYDKSATELEDMKNRLIVLEDKRNKADEARKNKDRITPDIKSLSKSIGSIAGKISDIKANRMIIESYKNYKKDFEEIVDDYESSYKQSEELKEKLKAIEAPTDKEMVRLSDKVEQLQHDINDSKNTAIQLRGDYQLVSERLDNANTSLGKALEQEKERKRIMRKHNVAQTSLSVLSAFREHLAKEAVPQITDYASDMISSITDGKFISIMINQRYAISVKRNDGNVLDVKMLSGGEKDTVAICLRLAISMMLSGGEPSMIILDEVLTAMDDARANSILNSIQESGHGQVIIIAHNDIIRQISDKAVVL